MNNKSGLIGGVVLLVVATLIFVSLSDDGGGGGTDPERKERADLACTLATSGVGLIAAGVAHGNSASQIAATVGGPALTSYACKQAIRTFVDTPTQPVQLQILTPQGTVPTAPTGQQLALPPPQSPASQTPLAISCLRWNSHVLYNLCVEGRISPPSS